MDLLSMIPIKTIFIQAGVQSVQQIVANRIGVCWWSYNRLHKNKKVLEQQKETVFNSTTQPELTQFTAIQ